MTRPEPLALDRRLSAPRYDIVESLEVRLRATAAGDGPFSYASCVRADEAEAFPAEAFAALDAWGMQAQYVPPEYGGALMDFERLAGLIRAISRRDLTVAIGHGVSFLGAMGAWHAGNEEQKRHLASRLLGGERMSLALTERDHGGDLLGMELAAAMTDTGYRLSGEKWLINGATRNNLITVFARTAQDAGPRGFSLFLFDKATAPASSFEALPKVRTLGVRGSDISGIRFTDTPLASGAMIGRPGQGFELVLQTLQLSRLLCGAFSLGATETALSVTMQFALERRLYGRRVFDIPQTRRMLAESWVDLLVCDSLATSALRAMHVVPEQGSVLAAVVKYFVPTLLDGSLKQLATVLGARYYLREDYAGGIFQKILRDSALIGLFDGSTVVNLYSLAMQMSQLTKAREVDSQHSAAAAVATACDLSAELPEFAWSGLELASGGRNFLVETLDAAIEELRSVGGIGEDMRAALLTQYGRLRERWTMLALEVQGGRGQPVRNVAPSQFDQARAYCVITAAAATLQVWLANRTRIGGAFAEPDWPLLACARLNAILCNAEASVDDALYHRVSTSLLVRHDQGRTAGIVALHGAA